MFLDSRSGLIDDATCISSPNCDSRPASGFVNSLVIHAISLPPGEFGGNFVEQLFCNCLNANAHPYFATICKLKVSAHFYISRTGSIVQFVSTRERAWHAGESIFRGLEKVNDFSIGIELEGCDTAPFTDAQYHSLIELSLCLSEVYPAITKTRIVGHSEIAPGRKTDPGPLFEWDRYLKALS